MATDNYLPEVLETTEPELLATAFIFTEGPPGIRLSRRAGDAQPAQ